MNSKPRSEPSLTTRLVRAGIAGLATVAAVAGLSTGCLDRPVAPATPNTTNIVVEQIRQDRVDKIDLLFMIDNSISMADKQQILAEAVPELVRRLVQPICVDDTGTPIGGSFPCANGKPEFEPVIDIHIGVISSSLGGHGGNVCGNDPPGNDKAHLMPDVRPSASLPQDGAGFLWWNPGSAGNINDALVTGFANNFAAHVQAAGENGCGFEASLESWYRFLVDPEPPSAVTQENGQTVAVRGPCVDENNNPNPAADQVICTQRRDFLRPSSLVSIIMLSDENDCSIRDSDVGWYVSTINNPNNTPYPLARATDACKTDPNGACCRSCLTVESAPPANCVPLAQDPECSKNTPLDPNTEDKVNLRCWDQKRRFGIDFLHPLQRYVNALKRPQLCLGRLDLDSSQCDPAQLVANPLFTDLTGGGTGVSRDPALVFLAGIVGVPWQDIATDETLNDPNSLRFLTAPELTNKGRWDWITGDSVTPPQDPLMVESPNPRTGNHPLGDPSFNPADPASAPGANAINGHEWLAHDTQQGDLQYACVFPLVPTRDCTNVAGSGCDCKAPNFFNNPLCQDSAGNYSTVQHAAKGYPGLRQLGVLRGFGDNSIVASICPKILDTANPSYGYNPAVAAIIDRLKEALGGRCLPRTIAVNDDGSVPCKVVEATLPAGGACACDGNLGRVGLDAVEGGGELGKAVQSQLQTAGVCSPNAAGGLPACSDYCLCLVNEYADPIKTQCLTDPNFSAEAGWCYVDPLPEAQGGQSIGDPSVIANCPASEPRILRFEPQSGAIAFIACLGGVVTGSSPPPTGADGG